MEKTEKIKRDLLSNALKNIVFDGWSEKSLKDAAKTLFGDEKMAFIAFPNGVYDLVDYYAIISDEEMVERIKKLDLKNMKLTEKIIKAVMIRLRLHNNKEVIKKLLSYYSEPSNAHSAVINTARTIDKIWRAVGDSSYDFSFYTKRFSLATIYSATVLYWLSDDSENNINTEDFLRRRISDLMKFGKFKKTVQESFSKFSGLFSNKNSA